MKNLLSMLCLSAFCNVSVLLSQVPVFLEYTLPNGLKVFLQEDKTQPNAVGAIVVKGGSKCDPPEATGIAHYFEHMMFKGTDSIGTLDFVLEKQYLDSIEDQYERLATATDPLLRTQIQKKINELSLQAAQYAIPNEFDRLVSHFGGTGLNAFTSEDNIVYFNTFPGEKTPLWIELYAHRFINPVFRLFQSELETVYEEKNMYADFSFTAVQEKWQEVAHPNHPYGTQTILGSAEHLKNPSLSKMREYFDKYYVPSNMALVLTGYFDTEQILPLIEQYFGAWEARPSPLFPSFPAHAFKGVERTKVRMTPIRLGALIYRGLPSSEPDALKLEILQAILSNEGQTGLLDDLRKDRQLMMSYAMVDSKVDQGSISLLYMPKLLGQSMGKAEKRVLEKLELLKQGDFDDRLLEIAKVEYKMNFYRYMENPSWRLYSLIDVFNNNQTFAQYAGEQLSVEDLTKEDIVEMAQRYFGQDYAVLQSRTGFPKKDKVKKPDFEPILPLNTERESEYALRFKAKDTLETLPLFLNIGKVGEQDKEVLTDQWGEYIHYFSGDNPVNNIFQLTFRYGLGTRQSKDIEWACRHLSELGTESLSQSEFAKELQLLGGSFSASASDNYFTLRLEGLEENLRETILLFSALMEDLQPEEGKIKLMLDEAKQERKVEQKSAQDKISYVFDYSRYGEQAMGLQRKSLKEIKKLKSEDLIEEWRRGLLHEVQVIYSGRQSPQTLKSLLLPSPMLRGVSLEGHFKDYLPLQRVEEPTVYFMEDPKAVQSQIYIWTPGRALDEEQRLQSKVFNEYFGGGMEGIVFQEIREFRSLAYSCFGQYLLPNNLLAPTLFLCGLSTQADKSSEAIDVFLGLLKDMPRKPERVDNIKNAMVKSVNASRTSFRSGPYNAANWQLMGYDRDPKIQALDYVNGQFDFEQIVDFYDRELEKSNYVICVVGNKKALGKDTLKRYGKVKELKWSQVVNP